MENYNLFSSFSSSVAALSAPNSDKPNSLPSKQSAQFWQSIFSSGILEKGINVTPVPHTPRWDVVWARIRSELGVDVQIPADFLAKAGLTDDSPLFVDLGWSAPVQNNLGFLSFFTFFVTEFALSFDATVKHAVTIRRAPEDVIVTDLDQLSQYINIPRRFFYKHDPADYRPQAMCLYARYLYRRYPSKSVMVK